MQQILRNLKDVSGVLGSFVLNNDGALVEKEMPAFVGVEVYPDLGRRLITAFGTLDTVLGEFDDMLLKFDEQWIYSRRLVNGVLSILSSTSVNLPALRMATNIAATKVDTLIPQVALLSTEPVAPEPVIAAPAPAVQPTAPVPRRFWRGQAID